MLIPPLPQMLQYNVLLVLSGPFCFLRDVRVMFASDYCFESVEITTCIQGCTMGTFHANHKDIIIVAKVLDVVPLWMSEYNSLAPFQGVVTRLCILDVSLALIS